MHIEQFSRKDDGLDNGDAIGEDLENQSDKPRESRWGQWVDSKYCFRSEDDEVDQDSGDAQGTEINAQGLNDNVEDEMENEYGASEEL